jgi:hypothetical protein
VRLLPPGKSIDSTSGSALCFVVFGKEYFGLFTNIAAIKKIFNQRKTHLSTVYVKQDGLLSKPSV